MQKREEKEGRKEGGTEGRREGPREGEREKTRDWFPIDLHLDSVSLFQKKGKGRQFHTGRQTKESQHDRGGISWNLPPFPDEREGT